MRAVSFLYSPKLSAVSQSWRGLARPSGSTAQASAQISPAPLRANLSYRRIVSSPGAPSAVPSQPSIGWITMRLCISCFPKVSFF